MGWSIVDTEFDSLGRACRVSNPYRAADVFGAVNPSGVWTTTTYDALSRVRTVTTPDTATVNTEYSGNRTLAIDQAGKKRISQTDALGRLTNLWEDRSPDAASGTVSVSFPNHPEITVGHQTDYLYDAMDNLRKVTQGAQTRWFSYNSLSRLIRVKNPEQNTNGNLVYTDSVTGQSEWSMAFSYDANGNLTQRIDARGVVANYFYDALNRNWGTDYINGSQVSYVRRSYDGAVNGKGHLHTAGTQEGSVHVTHMAIDSYDAFGRPLSKRQHFWRGSDWGDAYATQQSYDLAGNVKTLTYPSGHTVNYSYDQAGRLSSFSGNLGGSPRTYADTIGYNAAGQMIKERFGTNTSLYHNSHYNNRQQLVAIRLGDSATDAWNWSRGAFDFFYGSTAVASGDKFANDTDNNGNLRRQINWVQLAGGGYVIPQRDDYTYDTLNRISSFTEAQMNSSGQWTLNVASQSFSYDRFGNRQITGASGGVNNYNPSYDQASNRINGLGYDAAGNITLDPLTGGTMTYDAENRLLTATSGGGGSYVYNSGGKRVRRITAGQETWHVYGCGGELLAEYAAGAAPSAPLKEYGYRGGQLLIIAESGSGGGVSLVKPASESIADIGGQAGPGMDGNADELFVVDEPVADLEFNEDSGLTTADAPSNNNTGTLIDGVTGTTAGGYGNALSFNGIGGESLVEHPAGAAPSAPQKEYRYRRGLSIVPAQSSGVVYPSANQTPDPGQGGYAVEWPSNTGHDSTSVYSSDSPGGFSTSELKTARWSAFPSVPGQIVSIRLKFDWSISGSLDVSVNENGTADASYQFGIGVSLNGGSSWALSPVSSSNGIGVAGPGPVNDSAPIDGYGSVDINLTGANISQIQVRDRLFVSTDAGIPGSDGSATASFSATVSNIRLEVETDTTAPVISNVAAGGITTSSATITWNTNENSDSQVEYGTTPAYGQSTTLNPAPVTAHSQGLFGLTSGTLYHYRVKSRDAAGNLAVSGDFTFTTAPPLDTTPPTVISYTPPAGANNVNADANVNVTFSEPMDAATVNGSTVELRNPSNAVVSATVSYNAASLSATLDPTTFLAAGVTYTARVRGGGTDPRVKDVAGNALATDMTWTFTIGSGGIKWLVTDHLGSTRMVIDETGSLAGIKRHDFAAFGEELFAGVGIRSASNGYSGDSVRQKFGSYERDNETGLDFAEARYHANIQGRFTSVDPIIFAPHRLSDPQSLNLYSYVRNNPLTLVDPTGMGWYQGKDQKFYWFDKPPDPKLYKHLNIGPNGYQITNVQGATGQYARYNGHNITLYNDSRRLRDNGVYRPPVPEVTRGSELGWTTVKFVVFPWMIGAAIGYAGPVAGVAVAINIYEEESQGPLILGTQPIASEGYIDPNQVRFSQDNHSPNFSDSRKICHS